MEKLKRYAFPVVLVLTALGLVHQGYSIWRGEHIVFSSPVFMLLCFVVLVMGALTADRYINR